MITTLIAIPTRGLVFGPVMESVLSQVDNPLSVHTIVKSGASVPEVFDLFARAVVESGVDQLWIVEEDTVPPRKILAQMTDLLWSRERMGAVCIDYPLPGEHSCVVTHEKTGEMLWCGLGCTMIKTEVFQKMIAPWFRSDWQFVLDPEELRGWRSCDPTKQYGLYDVLFFTRMRALGYTIAQLPGQCKHLTTDGTFEQQKNGAVLTITQKATVCTPSVFPVDPKDWWKDSLLQERI